MNTSVGKSFYSRTLKHPLPNNDFTHKSLLVSQGLAVKNPNPGYSDFAPLVVIGIAQAAIGLGQKLGINFRSASSHNADHRNNIAAEWDSGDHAGALQYMKSYIDGVGGEARDHINNLKKAFADAMASKDVAKATAYNVYLKSFLEGVGSPLPMELLTAFAGIRPITNADFGITDTKTSDLNSSAIPATPAPTPVATSTSTPTPAATLPSNQTKSAVVYDANGNPILTKSNTQLYIIIAVAIVVVILIASFMKS